MKHFNEKDVAKVKSVSQESTKEKHNKNDAQRKRAECICWDKAKGCKCLSRGYSSPCICCKFHNKTAPQVRPIKYDLGELVWIQSRYPNQFYVRNLSLMRRMPYESDYARSWFPTGAIRSNGQEILCAPDDGYD